MSEDPNFSIDWHKGFQMGLYSGKTTERERIIKLLEDEGECNHISQETFNYVVSIIKGENK